MAQETQYLRALELNAVFLFLQELGKYGVLFYNACFMLIPTVIISVSTGDFQQVNMACVSNTVTVGEAELGCARVSEFRALLTSLYVLLCG